jgi:AraC-like DNA-binding protein
MQVLASTTFSFVDVLLFLGAAQGLLLLLWLSNVKRQKAPGNSILLFLLSTAVIVLIGRALHYRVEGSWYFYLATVIDTSIFMFGPLGYWFLRGLLFKDKSKQQLFPHFIPAILHLLYAIWFLFQSPAELKNLYQEGILPIAFFGIELVGIISFSLYNFLAFRYWLIYQKQVKLNLSYQQAIRKFVLGFLIFWAFFNGLWIAQFLGKNVFFKGLLEPVHAWQTLFSYVNIWIVICIAIYALAYAGLRLPEVFQTPPILPKKSKKARLPQAEVDSLQKSLRIHMEDERMYLDAELSLQKLAERLHTSTNNLSWLLNHVHQKSFYDYINSYRIEEVKARIKKGDHHSITLLAIALEAGFKSKSTFNKVFKHETGMSPSIYAKTMTA